MALAGATMGHAAGEPKRVLILHSFGLRFKPWIDYAEAIRSHMSQKAPWPLDFKDIPLLNNQFRRTGSDNPFVDYLHDIFQDSQPDLIIGIGAPAATFVQSYRERIFPNVPLLFTGVEERRIEKEKMTKQDTVVAAKHD